MYKSTNHKQSYAMHYSKFDQGVNTFIKVLTDWSLTRT